MKGEGQDILIFRNFLRLKDIFSQIKQISYNVSTTEKRYPAPEAMTKQELQELTKTYLALGFDIEEIYKEWKKIYKEYGESTK